jgi:hypothetical protein
MEQRNLASRDTPLLPGTRFQVHDDTRPQPRLVAPGTASTQELPGAPPSDALRLFGGTDLSHWVSVHGGEAPWKVENGYLEVVPGTGDIRTRAGFGDCQLHLEWVAPAVVTGEGQERGNSGVLLIAVYEIQVLDGYENPTYPDGTTAHLWPIPAAGQRVLKAGRMAVLRSQTVPVTASAPGTRHLGDGRTRTPSTLPIG